MATAVTTRLTTPDERPEAPLVGGFVPRLLVLLAASTVGAGVALEALNVARFWCAALLGAAVTAAATMRWRRQWRAAATLPGRTVGVVLLVALVAVLFVRKHDPTFLPVAASPDMVHNVASVARILAVQRPLRESDASTIAFPELTAYPVTGQYLSAFVAWAGGIDPGRATELIGFGAIALALWSLWALGANLASVAFTAFGARRSGDAIGAWHGADQSGYWSAALGFLPVLLFLASPVFGTETITRHYFHAQMVGTAAVLFGLALVVLDAAGARVSAVEIGAACALVIYSYTQYFAVVPAAFAVSWFLRRWQRRRFERLLAFEHTSRFLAVGAMSAAAMLGYFIERLSVSGNIAALDGTLPDPSLSGFGGPFVVALLGVGVIVTLAMVIGRGSPARQGLSAVFCIPLVAAAVSMGKLAVMYLLVSSFSPLTFESSRYYRLKNVYPTLAALQALAVLAAVPVALLAMRRGSARRTGRPVSAAMFPAVAGLAVIVFVASASSYAEQRTSYDVNEYEAARWAHKNLDDAKVDTLSIGVGGYMISVGELGRYAGDWSNERLHGRYPLQVWLTDADRRYLVTPDLDRLNATLGPSLASRLRVLHRHGPAAVVDRGPTPWYAAKLRWVVPPHVEGGEIVGRVAVTNSGVAEWPAEAAGVAGSIRVGGRLLSGDTPSNEFRASVQPDPHLPTPPGATLEVVVRTPLPAPGTYRFWVDVVCEEVIWFDPTLSPAIEAPVSVGAAPA